VRTPAVETVLLVDLSITGARIAILRDTELTIGHELEMAIKPQLQLQVDTDVLLNIKCQVVGEPEDTTANFPGVVYRGLKFTDVSERDLIVLHAYVQQNLVEEMDSLAHVLLRARKVIEWKE
jgi:hypothetical protein